MDDERELTELEQAEAELEECENDLIDVAKQRDAAQAELTQYIGWKLSAQLEAARAEQAEAALAALQTPCMWTVDGQGWFVSQCDGNLRRKNGKFCPACGHPVEVAP